ARFPLWMGQGASVKLTVSPAMPSPTLIEICFGGAGKMSASSQSKLPLGEIVVAELAGLRMHVDEQKEGDLLFLVADIIHAQHDIRLGPIDRDGLRRDLDRAELLGLAEIRYLLRRGILRDR